jgi:hypothetical protein
MAFAAIIYNCGYRQGADMQERPSARHQALKCGQFGFKRLSVSELQQVERMVRVGA